MNRQQLIGGWSQVKGLVKENWGKITDDDIAQINGKREQLLGKIQQKYGYAVDQAEEELRRWEKRIYVNTSLNPPRMANSRKEREYEEVHMPQKQETQPKFFDLQNYGVFGLVNNKMEALKVLHRLEAEGYTKDDISLIIFDRSQDKFTEQSATGAITQNDSLPEDLAKSSIFDASKGATAGCLLGGTIGLLGGLGSIAVPGLGALIATGPIMGALSGSLLGGCVGMLVGTLVGLGFTENQAQYYQKRLQDGKYLICVHTAGIYTQKRANVIFEEENVKDICCTKTNI